MSNVGGQNPRYGHCQQNDKLFLSPIDLVLHKYSYTGLTLHCQGCTFDCQIYRQIVSVGRHRLPTSPSPLPTPDLQRNQQRETSSSRITSSVSSLLSACCSYCESAQAFHIAQVPDTILFCWNQGSPVRLKVC
jgi:hypothetical protein